VPRAAVDDAVTDGGDGRAREPATKPGGQRADRATPVQAGVHGIVGDADAAAVARREAWSGTDAVDLAAGSHLPAGMLAAENRELQA